jgi:putative inorganic carbon (HCO3(-)) transporter
MLIALVAVGTAAILATATVLTGCRGGYNGLFVGLGAIVFATVWRAQPSKRIWLGLSCLSLAVLATLVLHFALPTFDQRVASIFSGSEHSSNAYRFAVYTASLKMLKDNWWVGVGPGNQAFVQAYGLYMRSSFDALGAYCVPLEVAIEAGILALASFIGLVLSVLARGHICFWSETADQGERWLAAGCSAALLAMMTQGLTDTVFYRPQVQFLFWLLVALLVSSQLNKPNQKIQD